MQPPEAGIIICTLQTRKVRHAKLSNVPKARQLGSEGIRVWTEAVWLRRVLQTGSQKQTLGVRQSLFDPRELPFLLPGSFLAELPPVAEQTSVRVARVHLGDRKGPDSAED